MSVARSATGRWFASGSTLTGRARRLADLRVAGEGLAAVDSDAARAARAVQAGVPHDQRRVVAPPDLEQGVEDGRARLGRCTSNSSKCGLRSPVLKRGDPRTRGGRRRPAPRRRAGSAASAGAPAAAGVGRSSSGLRRLRRSGSDRARSDRGRSSRVPRRVRQQRRLRPSRTAGPSRACGRPGPRSPRPWPACVVALPPAIVTKPSVGRPVRGVVEAAQLAGQLAPAPARPALRLARVPDERPGGRPGGPDLGLAIAGTSCGALPDHRLDVPDRDVEIVRIVDRPRARRRGRSSCRCGTTRCRRRPGRGAG